MLGAGAGMGLCEWFHKGRVGSEGGSRRGRATRWGGKGGCRAAGLVEGCLNVELGLDGGMGW